MSFLPASRQHLDFDRINRAALSALPALVARWLPDGKRVGREWVSRNPRRSDRKAGSFRVNLNTGKWADFATDDRGGDPISLAAFLAGTGQRVATCRACALRLFWKSVEPPCTTTFRAPPSPAVGFRVSRAIADHAASAPISEVERRRRDASHASRSACEYPTIRPNL